MMTFINRKQLSVVPVTGWKSLGCDADGVWVSGEIIAFIFDIAEEVQDAEWGTRLSVAVIAVSVDGAVSDDTALESPDGRIEIPADRAFNSREEYFDYWKEEEAKKKVEGPKNK